MKKSTAIVTALTTGMALLGVSVAARADHRDDRDASGYGVQDGYGQDDDGSDRDRDVDTDRSDDRNGTRHGDPRIHYGNDRGQDYADVISTRPIFSQVRVDDPRQECRDEQVVYDDGEYRHHDNAGVGGLLGAIVGGVVGNQFGHGGGRVATTAVGAVLGASAGASIGRNGDDYRSRPVVSYEQHCRTVDGYRVEQRIAAYDVAYRYHGHVYNTQLSYDPGSRIAVNVDVRPAGYQAY